VNYKIVKSFITDVEQKALGQDVLKSLKPGEQVVKIVKDDNAKLIRGYK
jgi:signal recognition particle subunit SRP54